MKKYFSQTRKWGLLFWCSGMIVMHLLFLLGDCSAKTTNPQSFSSIKGRKLLSSEFAVKLHVENDEQVVIENGLVRVILSIPDGDVLGIGYNGIDNVLESSNEGYDRGYLDVVWNVPGNHSSTFQRIKGTKFSVIMENKDQVEVSFLRKWESSMEGSSVPVNIDKRYILLRGSSGFYSYAIFERLEKWPDIEIDQIRIVYKLEQSRFQFMSISGERQRLMPMAEDRSKGQALAYPEAVLLTNPSNPQFRGEVDDKYQYSCENKDNTLHGWSSYDSDPAVGFWMITPSNEFRNAGPIKQDLTSHVGPITLSMFVSTHYAGKEVTMRFQDGKPWKKVFGPVYTYLNSISSEEDSSKLWTNAQEQRSIEVESWPYNFPQSENFLFSEQRGTVIGNLLVKDRYLKQKLMWAKSAYIGLALPGDVGSWQRESVGYQFWARTNNRGHFTIKNIVPGDYNLYAWVPGFIGDYKYYANITITPGSVIKLGSLVYKPPRNGPTLWEIGVPDRTAQEFYVPTPYPTLMNKLYNNQPTDKFRQYGLWERYADLYPNNDLVYNVDVNNFRQDWFFAHVIRNIGNKTYEPTTWQIIFQVENPSQEAGNYTLQLAVASSNGAELQVRINEANNESPPLFFSGLIGGDNAIARHGIHGLYWLYSIQVPSNLLINGTNTIYLRQSRHLSPFEGLMYDYIRLEGPPLT